MKNIIDNLTPCPKYVNRQGNSRLYISRNFTINCPEIKIANIFNSRFYDTMGFKLRLTPYDCNSKIKFSYSNSLGFEEYTLSIKDCVTIQAGGYNGMLYATYTLMQLIILSKNMLPQVEIKDSPSMAMRGFYEDITRGRVPKMEKLKQLVDMLSYYKYNQLQLYIEHSFAFEGMQQLWYDKSPLSASDILELDSYASDRGIELIPSLTTFGHMYEIMRTQKYKHLCEREFSDQGEFSFIDRQLMHTLNVFDEDSFKLVCNMIDQYLPLFKSDKFNICADETFDLCKFKNAHRLKDNDAFEIYKNFALKIANYVKSKGKIPMMWDDIILKAENTNDLPDDIIYLDWDYSPKPKKELREKIAQKPRLALCSGTSSWNRLINDYDTMFSNIDNMLIMAKELNVEGYYVTNWGDYGNIPMFSLIEIPLAYVGAITWEGKPREDKYEFLENLGRLIHNDSQLLHLLIDISKYHIVTYFEIVFSLHEHLLQAHGIDRRIIELSKKLEDLDYAKLSAIEEIFYSKLSQYKDKNFVLDVLNIIQGIRIFNKFDLQSYKYDGSFDELTAWYYDYCQIYRRDNEESELNRNTEIIRKLMLRYGSKE